MCNSVNAMTNMTVSLPQDLKEEMNRHHEVNWSGVVRRAIQEHLHRLAIAEAIARKSKLTQKDIEELDRLVKKGIAKRHGRA